MDRLRGKPALSTVVKRECVESIFNAALCFSENEPWRVLDNTFALRVITRSSHDPESWKGEQQRLDPDSRCTGDDPSELKNFKSDIHRTDDELEMFCVVAGNTDFTGRGLYAFNSMKDLKAFLHPPNSREINVLCFNYQDRDLCSRQEIKDIKRWKVRLADEKFIPYFCHAPHSLRSSTEFPSNWVVLPDAAHLQWIDIAMRGIAKFARHGGGDVFVIPQGNQMPSIAIPVQEVEFRFQLDGWSECEGSNFGFARILAIKIGNCQGPPVPEAITFFPGGHNCYFCGLPDSREKFGKCAKCRSIVYCSTRCQRQDWQRHKLECCAKSPSL